MSTATVTDETFTEVLRGSKVPTFLYVWAPWCGPCKMVKPHFEALSECLSDKATFLNADLQSFGAQADTFNIKSTPTLIVFEDGVEKDRRSGAMMRGQLESWLVPHLSSTA